MGYCRSVSGTARRLRRETGPENQSEQGRDDENVPGEVVHAANLDTVQPHSPQLFHNCSTPITKL